MKIDNNVFSLVNDIKIKKAKLIKEIEKVLYEKFCYSFYITNFFDDDQLNNINEFHDLEINLENILCAFSIISAVHEYREENIESLINIIIS